LSTNQQIVCEARDISIENPFYTYCANFHVRDGVLTPVGPVYVASGSSHRREVWFPAPVYEGRVNDLLRLLVQLDSGEVVPHFGSPPRELAWMVIEDLGNLDVDVVMPALVEIARGDDQLRHIALSALTKIPGDDGLAVRSALESLLEASDPDIRAGAEAALIAIAEAERRTPLPQGAELDRLVAALGAWRDNTAEQLGIADFAVVQDRTIVEIARWRPTSEEELAAVSGVGPVTIGRYGADIIGVVAEVTRVDQ
jgi:hypothetical protein